MNNIPTFYAVFFGLFEPSTTFAGFVYAWFFQQKYYSELIPTATVSVGLSDTNRVLLLQLGNTYLILFFVSAFIWSRTRDENVLRGLTWALYLGDIGHLYTIVSVQGLDFFVNFDEWNALAWGNIGITVS